jgi:hypothetical protein
MSNPIDEDEMREEYDFSKGVRGKHAARYAEGTNLVLLDPDVAEEFSDSSSVNNALRFVIRFRLGWLLGGLRRKKA